jgi:hypothetical protein
MAVNDEELRVMADEELASAVSLKWAELQRITPWGDTFDAFAPSGRKVEIERRYLWAHDPVGAVLVEVEIRDRSNRTGVEARALLAPPASR